MYDSTLVRTEHGKPRVLGAAILSYGVGTFSELPESEYADILKQAEAIANAA